MERPKQRKWWFGVCADFSETVGIPFSIVRLFVLLYIPVRLGPVFYFIYYLGYPEQGAFAIEISGTGSADIKN